MAETLPVSEALPDRPVSTYDLHKLTAETYLKLYARSGTVRGACLRLPNLYGPGPRSSSRDRGILNLMIRRALGGEPLTVYGRGEFIRDYLFVEDAVAAFVEAARRPSAINGEHFVLGSGAGSTIAEALGLVAEVVARRTGRRVRVEHVPPPADLAPIEQRNFVADVRKIYAATGWRPVRSLPEGIERTAEAFSRDISAA
jgi:nucleoside-diphosphate-sugar epimerase